MWHVVAGARKFSKQEGGTGEQGRWKRAGRALLQNREPGLGEEAAAGRMREPRRGHQAKERWQRPRGFAHSWGQFFLTALTVSPLPFLSFPIKSELAQVFVCLVFVHITLPSRFKQVPPCGAHTLGLCTPLGFMKVNIIPLMAPTYSGP